MRRILFVILAAICSLAPLAAQNLDNSSALTVRPWTMRTYFPGVCNPGEIMTRSDQSYPSNVYVCDQANTWHLFNAASTGLPDPGANGLVYRPSVGATRVATASDINGVLTYTPVNPANNLSELSSASAARANLGLGTSATQPASAFQAALGYTAANSASLPSAVYSYTSASTASAPAYQYKTAITDASSSSYSNYANYWIDDGGFPGATITTCTAVTGTTCTAFNPDRETFRVTGVAKSGLLEHTVWINSQCGNGELGCVPLNVFANSQSSGSTLAYGANVHVTSCGGWKCNGTNFTDYDKPLIAFEADTETRAPGGVKTTASDIGIYSACVNCNSSKNSAFVADANASLGVGYSSYVPWGIAYQTTPYGAVTAFSAAPQCIAANGPCQSQPMVSFAYIDGAGTKANASFSVLGTGVSQWVLPGMLQFTNGAGTSLRPIQALVNYAPQTANYTMLATDMDSGIFSNVGAAGTISLTLPTPAQGMAKTFVVGASQTLNIVATNSAVICYNNNCTGANGTLASSAPYSEIYIEYFSATRWNISWFEGSSWTVDGTAVLIPCGYLPALTGDVTTTAGGCATTVGKINGGAVPTSATVLASNGSGQLGAATAANVISTLTYTPTHVSQLSGSGAGGTVAASTTNYLGFGFAAPAAASNTRAVAMSAAGTLKNFVMTSTGAQPSSGSLVCTLIGNGSAIGSPSSISVTFAASDAAETKSDTANAATVTQGEQISVSCANAATAVSATLGAVSIGIQ